MKKRYLGLICILYSGMITYIYFSKQLSNFIAPSMQKYTLISVPILFIMGLAIIFKEEHYHFKVSDLVLVLPIVILIISGSGKLSLNASNNRNTTFGRNKTVTTSKTTTTEEKNNSSEISKDFDFDIVDEVYTLLGDGITYNSKPERLKGKTIRVKGFSLLKGDGIPEGYFALGKYFVSCCTADAGFGGFIVKNNESYNIKNNTWYVLEGIIDTAQDSYGTPIGIINITSIKEINGKKETTYVYPCYSYSEEACMRISEYNIEY